MKKLNNKHYSTLKSDLTFVIGLINKDTPLDEIEKQMKEHKCTIKFEHIQLLLDDCEDYYNNICSDVDITDEIDNLVYLKKISASLGCKIKKFGVTNLKQFEKYTFLEVRNAEEEIARTKTKTKIFGKASFVELTKIMIDRNRCFADKDVDNLKQLYNAYCEFINA